MTQWSQPQPHYQPSSQLQLEQQYDIVPNALDGHDSLQPTAFNTNFTLSAYSHLLPPTFDQNPPNSRQIPNDQHLPQIDPSSSFGRPALPFPSMASPQRQNYQTHTVPFNPNIPFYDGAAQPFPTNGVSPRGASEYPHASAAGSIGNPDPSPTFVTSPDAMQQPQLNGFQTVRSVPPMHSYYIGQRDTDDDRGDTVTPRAGLNKRPRGGTDDPEEVAIPDRDPENDGTQKKPPGACQRCKTLKVRCEFKTDFDACKRCLNGGHECTTPGRKKRRTPPKREHLLNQIREQASHISDLMAKLEIANRSRRLSESFTDGSRAGTDSALFDSSDADHPDQLDEAKPDVQNWIAKARESVDAFNAYISSAGVSKSFVVNKDYEGDEEDDDEEDNQDHCDITVEEEGDVDGDAGASGEAWDSGLSMMASEDGESAGPRSKSHDRISLSSAGTAARREEKMAILPHGAAPIGLIANMALRSSRRRPSNSAGSSDEETGVGVGNDNFFRASPGPDVMRGRSVAFPPHWQAPHILTRGIVKPEEAEKLFNIYFMYMNFSTSLLDPILYTAQKTLWRSPFLFTVICAIASRYYTERPELYARVMHYAQLAAGTALISGQKSVEMVQAYILLSLYPVPFRKWEDDRRWLFLGLAIRVATDMNLHLPITAEPQNEQHAREMLNRTRVWLNCFNLDRSTGSEYGKPPIVTNSDYVANHSETWWNSSAYNIPHFDIHLCAYNAELKVMAKFRERIYTDPHHPTGLNMNADFEQIASETDDELKQLGDKWFKLLSQTDMTVPQNCFRTDLLRLAYSYARLIALAFGFQHAFGKSHTDENPFLQRCYRAATDVVTTVVYRVGRPSQKIYLKHGPEAQSVFLTFASAFLVKLLQPKFVSYLSMEQRVEIRSLVQQVVDLLGSPDVAIDDRHGPKLYARFLKGLLSSSVVKGNTPSPGKQPHMNLQQQQQQQQQQKPRAPKPIPATSSMPTSPEIGLSEIHHSVGGASGVGGNGGAVGVVADGRPIGSPPPQQAPSPTSTSSMSPPPNEAAASFDHFAPLNVPVDPFNAYTLDVDGSGGFGLNPADFLSSQLPLDQLLEMAGWPEVNMPDFAWQQSHGDANMRNTSDMFVYGAGGYLPTT